MNKEQFLETLQRGLADVPAEERVAALQYYTEYLDDAGPEREAEVLEELGSPDGIAAEIRADSEKEGWTPPERTHEVRIVASAQTAEAAPAAEGTAEEDAAPSAADAMASDTMWGGSYPVIPPSGAQGQYGQPPLPPDYHKEPARAGGQPGAGAPQPEAPPQYDAGGAPPPPPGPDASAAYPPPYGGAYAPPPPAAKPWSAGKIVALVLSIIFLWPFILVFIALLFVLLLVLIIVLAVPLIVGIALVASSIGGFFFGGVVTAVLPPSGIVLIGLSLVILALGLLCTWGGVVVLKKTVPALFKGLFKFVQKIFHRV